MKYLPFIVCLIATPALAQVATGVDNTPGDPIPFQLVSIDLADGQPIPTLHTNDEFGCTGKNQSPTLSWTYPPEGTKSFAVTMFDETARGGEGWLHWAVLNIPARESILQRGVGYPNQPYPQGTTLIPNSWGNSKYNGPCPPVGDKKHKYTFTVYAMPDEFVEYPLNSLGWSTIDWFSDHALGKASITTTFQRLPPNVVLP